MKKLFALFAMLVLWSAAYAEFSSSQVELRTDLKNFLTEEGFQPEIDGDGDIKYKYQGKTYFISIIVDNEETPFLVNLDSYYTYPEGMPRIAVKLSAYKLNNWKSIKLVCGDSNFIIRSSMFIRNAEAFKQVFYRIMSAISDANSKFMDEMSEAQKELNDYMNPSGIN